MAKIESVSTPRLRIGKLPDLTPVKMTVYLEPEIHRALEDYARIYAQNYGDEIAPATLVPTMLAAFLGSDSGFKKARRNLRKNSDPA